MYNEKWLKNVAFMVFCWSHVDVMPELFIAWNFNFLQWLRDRRRNVNSSLCKESNLWKEEWMNEENEWLLFLFKKTSY